MLIPRRFQTFFKGFNPIKKNFFGGGSIWHLQNFCDACGLLGEINWELFLWGGGGVSF